MIKRSIQEEVITLVNIYVPNIGTPKYIHQIWTDKKGEIDRNTVIVGVFNTPVTSMDRSSREGISKAIAILNDPKGELDLIDILITLHPKSRIYIHGIFSNIAT